MIKIETSKNLTPIELAEGARCVVDMYCDGMTDIVSGNLYVTKREDVVYISKR